MFNRCFKLLTNQINKSIIINEWKRNAIINGNVLLHVHSSGAYDLIWVGRNEYAFLRNKFHFMLQHC